MKCPKVETMNLDGVKILGSVNFGGVWSRFCGAQGPFLWCAESVLVVRGVSFDCSRHRRALLPRERRANMPAGDDDQIYLRGSEEQKKTPRRAPCMQISSQEGGAASATPEHLGAGHLAGLEAVGAYVHLLALAIDHAVHALDVGTELTVGHAVGVADGATSNGVLTADFANFGHIETLLGRSGTTHLIKQIGTIAQNTGNASNLHEQIPAFCPRTCYAYR